jgi:predicted MPP superfamily phosphohydrolase
MLSYFTIVTLLALATHAWFERRLVRVVRLPKRWVRRLRLLLAANVALLPITLVVCVRAPATSAPWAVPLARAAFLDEGFCLLLVAALAAREASWIPLRILLRRVHAGSSEPDLERRRVLLALRGTGAAAVGLAFGATAVGHVLATAPAEVRRVALRIAGLSDGLRGLRVAQISDLHVGPTLRADTVAALVERVNALAPDVVVITGDLVDGFVGQLAGEVAAIGRLRAPLGCFFVTGNHEYFYRADEWVAHLREVGCTVLLNAHHVVERDGARLLLAGVCDESGADHLPGHGHDIEAALAGAPPADARVLLAHRPDCARRAAALGFDVQLSGHLHGGQVFPLTAMLRATKPYLAGLYEVGDMLLYVNRGAGYWGPPMRLGAPQEITLFELVG